MNRGLQAMINSHLLAIGLAVLLLAQFGCSSITMPDRPAPYRNSTTSHVDGMDFMPRLWKDTKAVYGSPENLFYLTGGYGLGIVLDHYGLEDDLADRFDKHNYLNDKVGTGLDHLGSGVVLLGGAAAWYGYSTLVDDREAMAHSQTLASALILTGVSTLGLKAIFRDERPNGVPEGYPSGHSAMSMAAATTLGELYGWKIGVPAVLLSGMVAFQRLDSREHDLDDIVGGFTLGWIVASAVAGRHKVEVLGAEVVPIIDPIQNGVGIGLQWRF